MRQRWITVVIGSALLVTACSASADDERTRLIVPFEAGDNTDRVARAIAPCLGDQLGTGMVVENRPGEQGVRAVREFVEAGADGRALLLTPMDQPVMAPLLGPDVGYDMDDFHYVGVAHSAPLVLFTAANGRFASAEQLLGAAPAAGPPLEVAHPTTSLTAKLTLDEINIWKKTLLESAPVDSDAEILRGVLAGDYPAGLTTVSADHLARIESGEITVLAAGGEFRPKFLPDTPTFHEVIGTEVLAGLPNDTTLIAPDNPTDTWHVAMSNGLDECLTPDIRREIGVDFVPEELVTHGELTGRYMDLQRAVRLVQNLPKVLDE